MSSPLFSAESLPEAGSIVYAEGAFFLLARGGETIEYDVYYDDVIGMPLHEGDFISTDDGTFLEIQLSSNRNIIKISEHTSFRIVKSEQYGRGELKIEYGRIRAKVGKLVGDQSFTLRGQSTVCGVRGTDFGMDVLAGEPGVLNEEIYCFEGEVAAARIPDVQEFDLSGVIHEAEVPVTAGTMVSYTTHRPSKSLAVQEIRPEIVDFWDANDFAVDQVLDTEETTEEQPSSLPIPPGPGGAADGTIDPGRIPFDPLPERDPGFQAQDPVAQKLTYRIPSRLVFLDFFTGMGSIVSGGATFSFNNRFQTSIFAGTSDASGLRLHGLAKASVFLFTGRISPSFSLAALTVTDFTNLAFSAGASIGLEIRFNRIIHAVYIENFFFVNIHPWSGGLPIIYKPGIGIKL